MSKHLALLVALLALAACGKGSDAPSSPASPPESAAPLVKIVPVSTLEAALHTIQSATLSCSDSNNCPAAVGMLLTADAAGGFLPNSSSVAACTAVLVGEDLALTNSHCIPSAVKLLPDLCKERVRLTLSASGTLLEENFACSSLLGFSVRETPMSPDLALIRLERKTNRAPMPTSRAGLADLAQIQAFKVTPDMKNLTGVLSSEKCVAAANTYRMPIFKNAADPEFTFAGCKAIPGNSGSPVVNAAGEIVALMQASLPLSDTSRTEWLKHTEETEFAPLALATSLSCLQKDLTQGWEWRSDCATVTEQDVALSRPRIRQFLEAAEPVLAPYLSQNAAFGFQRVERETKALTRLETVQPVCARTPQAGMLLEVRQPEAELSLRFNKFLQLLPAQVKILSEKTVGYRVSEDLSQLLPSDSEAAPLALISCE